MKEALRKRKQIRFKEDIPITEEPMAPQPTSDEIVHAKEATIQTVDSFCQWAQVSPNQYLATGATFKKLRAGKYNLRWFKQEPSVEYRPLDVDEIYVFPNSVAELVLAETQDFWAKENKYKKYNLLHRRGFLLHGAQGHGKTSIIQIIMQDVISKDGVIFMCNCDPDLVDQVMQNFRQIEPHRKLMCVFNDIDALIKTWGEDILLSILDGENQINHVLNIATSNYPESLDYRLTNRPRRFDHIIKVEAISMKEREMYFNKKLKFVDNKEKEKWLNASIDFSFAALTEMVIGIRILERDFDETIVRLKLMMKNKAVKNDDTEVGFSKGSGKVSSRHLTTIEENEPEE